MARDYVVLRVADDNSFRYVSNEAAATAEQACRQAAEGLTDLNLADGVTFTAVPARNFKPITLKAHTERKLVKS